MKIISSENPKDEPLLEIINANLCDLIPKNTFIIGTSQKGKLVSDVE
jgi:rRNA pseudouridine-1189 N-methylase Emg1 (Nep1/Mra1 family)